MVGLCGAGGGEGADGGGVVQQTWCRRDGGRFDGQPLAKRSKPVRQMCSRICREQHEQPSWRAAWGSAVACSIRRIGLFNSPIRLMEHATAEPQAARQLLQSPYVCAVFCNECPAAMLRALVSACRVVAVGLPCCLAAYAP